MTCCRSSFSNACLAVAALIASFTIPAAAGEPASPAPKTDISRIVSIGGDVTEILYALGLEGHIVAVDTTSVYPADALTTKKNVGYMRALSTEGVLSMSPTVILAGGHAGPPEVVAALKASSVPYISISAPDSPDGVGDRIRAIAAATGTTAKGEEVAVRVKEKFQALAARRAAVKKPVRALFLLSLQNGRAIAGGTNTAAHEILALTRGENAAASIEGYKPISDEAILSLAPDVILMMSRTQGPTGGAGKSLETEIAAMRGLSATPAVKNKRIFEIDGAALLQFGPRTADAALDLLTKMHAGIKAADLGK